VLKVSRSGFYAWFERPESKRTRADRRLGVLVGEAHARSRGTYGSPRVRAELRAHGEHVGRKRVARLMRAQALRGRDRRRFTKTTDSKHKQAVAPNLLQQDFSATAPDQRWVGDVTFLRTPDGWLYLAVLLDLYSRFVVGWALSLNNDRWLALDALDMAYKRRMPEAGLVHHTDRGSPYASDDYRKALADRGVLVSMSSTGNCYDNAAMESWFGMFKAELGDTFESGRAAARDIFDFIEVFYNGQRRHSTLGYLSPREFERAAPC
jgi:transposase InsO family protein